MTYEDIMHEYAIEEADILVVLLYASKHIAEEGVTDIWNFVINDIPTGTHVTSKRYSRKPQYGWLVTFEVRVVSAKQHAFQPSRIGYRATRCPRARKLRISLRPLTALAIRLR
jgi:hypothetical protein